MNYFGGVIGIGTLYCLGFSRHPSLASYSPYQLLCGREFILPNSIREKLAPVVDFNDPNIWAEYLQEWAQFF